MPIEVEGAGSGGTSQLKTVPFLIRKQRFTPNVLRKTKNPKETVFKAILIGKHFKILRAKKLEEHEKDLVFIKTQPSNKDPNARVVMTLTPTKNPLGQEWNLDGDVAVMELEY